ncbi:MAG: hypothetical protein LUC37_06585 [Prevotella sp.]|nr:hypothetical protein [Prevotella sp.]
MTQLYWSSNYNVEVIFYNYPNLTVLQELVVTLMFNEVQEYKSKQSKGNLFSVMT